MEEPIHSSFSYRITPMPVFTTPVTTGLGEVWEISKELSSGKFSLILSGGIWTVILCDMCSNTTIL